MQSRDRDALKLMLGAVMKVLHRVPADAPLGDVAMHVVGKAQVFIDSNAVAGRCGLADPACADGVRAFLRARFSAWPHLPPVGVEDVARRIEREGFCACHAAARLRWLAFDGPQNAPERVIAVLAQAPQTVLGLAQVAGQVVDTCNDINR